MKEYFIAENGQEKGPFSLKDLKYQTVLPDTLIWKEGWPAWVKAKEAAKDVPEIDLIINDTPPPPPVPETEEKPKKKSTASVLTSVMKASEGDLDAIGSLLGNKEKEQEETILEDKPSYTALFYGFIGEHLDKLLEKNQKKVGSDFFFTNLSKIRNYYKGLSETRQRSFTFLLSCFLIFALISVFSFDLFAAFAVTAFWAGFVALNQLKFIDNTFNKITDWVVLFTMGWLPKGIKRAIAKFAKFILFLIILYFIGFILGIVYMAYRIIIAFVNPDKLPSFEQGD